MLKNPSILVVVYKIFGVLLSIPFIINVIALARKRRTAEGME